MVQVDAQLLSGHLRQGGRHPLAHLDLSGKHSHPAVLADIQIGMEVGGVGWPPLGEGRRGTQADRHHHSGPREFVEGPAVKTRGGGHDPAPCMAACSIASTMRLWAPQRQRLWSIRSTMASRVGCGVS